MERFQPKKIEGPLQNWIKAREFLVRAKGTVSAKILWETGPLKSFFPYIEIPEKGLWSAEVSNLKNGKKQICVYVFDAFGKGIDISANQIDDPSLPEFKHQKPIQRVSQEEEKRKSEEAEREKREYPIPPGDYRLLVTFPEFKFDRERVKKTVSTHQDMNIETMHVYPKTPLEKIHMEARTGISFAGLHNFGLNTENDTQKGFGSIPATVKYKGVDRTTNKIVFQGSCLVNNAGHIVSENYKKDGVDMYVEET